MKKDANANGKYLKNLADRKKENLKLKQVFEINHNLNSEQKIEI